MFVRVPSSTGSSPSPRVRLPTAEWEQRPWPQDELVNASYKFYSLESRRLKRGRTQAELYVITRRWMFWFAWGTAILWLLAMALLSRDRDSIDVLLWALGIVFVASLLDKFFFDFIGLAAGLDLVSKDFTDARWDLICLSDASMVELVRSKAVIAQIRAWRAMLVAVGLRLSVVVQGLMWLFAAPFFTGGNWYDNGIYALTLELFSDLTVFIIVTYSALMIAGVYLVEPRWRLRALAAASVRSSAYSKDTTGGLMRIGGSFMRLSLAQAGTWFILSFTLGFSSGFIGLFSEVGGVIAGLIFWVLFTLFAAWMIRATYVGFARRRLNEAYISLMRRGGSF